MPLGVSYMLTKRQRKPKEQSRMDTPKQLATLGTQDTTQKTKTMSNTDLTKNWKRGEVNTAREG